MVTKVRGASETPPTQARPKTRVGVLIVDDDATKRFALRTVLAPLDEDVVEASSGADALRQLLRSEFAVVLLDVRMPIMDGYEATRSLKQTEWGKKTPVIAVTAYASREHMHKALNAGCCDFIDKPILDFAQMVKKIRAILGVENAQAGAQFQTA